MKLLGRPVRTSPGQPRGYSKRDIIHFYNLALNSIRCGDINRACGLVGFLGRLAHGAYESWDEIRIDVLSSLSGASLVRGRCPVLTGLNELRDAAGLSYGALSEAESLLNNQIERRAM